MHLHWCLSCNVPVLEQERCGLCESDTVPVEVTPPGDIRPAFEADLDLIRKTVDKQFGQDAGRVLVPSDRPILLNPIPHSDRMDEVIFDGRVMGSLKYDLGEGYRFICRMEAARRLAPFAKKGWVIVDDGAVDPISKGNSAMAAGVTEADPTIEKDDEVIVLTNERAAISAGMARMTGPDMLSRSRGAAVKSRWYSSPMKPNILGGGKGWKDVVRGNAKMLSRREKEARDFIRGLSNRTDLPIAVSFSGGKDSLATLLLALDAGLKPPILFIDTGLEFEETIHHVETIAETFELDLITESARDAFWEGLAHFGPPGRDFRWCCKTCKLGPTTRLISEEFPQGVLSLIGQRRYESIPRSRKGRKWKNPWVPGQSAASPIQNWTALHVWLYIFKKGVEFNIWYRRGLNRIGCWLCPASDMAELEIVKTFNKEFRRWEEYLKVYSKKRNLGDAYVNYGLWRWRVTPKSLQGFSSGEEPRREEDPFRFRLSEEQIPCETGLQAEGIFLGRLDSERMENMLNILGKVEREKDVKACRVENAVVFDEGFAVIRAKNEEELRKRAQDLERVVRKAQTCVACGTCVGLCPHGAIKLKDVAWIDEDTCVHCGSCLSPCPAADFIGEFFF